MINEFARTRIARHVAAANKAGSLLDESGCPQWPCEPTDEDETDFRAAFRVTHGTEPDEASLDLFWHCFNEEAFEAGRRLS